MAGVSAPCSKRYCRRWSMRRSRRGSCSDATWSCVVHEITPTELKEHLAVAKPAPLLLDVREPHEWAICRIEGSRLIPMSQIPEASAELDHDQDRAQLLPQLSANAGIVRDRQEITESNSPFFPPSTFYATTKKYGLNLNQALYHRDYYARLRQADASTGQARAQYDAEQQNLVVRVAQRYFNVLGASDDVEFARAEKDATGRLFEQNKQRFDVGLIAITDVHESQAAADLAAARAIAAETRLAVAEEELRELTGRSSAHLAAPQEEIPLVAPEPSAMQPWIDSAAEQNLKLLAAQFAVTAAQENTELQRSGHYPTLDANASYGYSDVSAGRFGGSVSNDTLIGLQLSVPLYQGGGVNARAREGEHRLTQSKEALEQQRLLADRQTRSAYLTVIDNINSVQALKQARLSNQTALEATEAGYEVGTRTTVDVVQAQRNLFDAKRNYAHARYDYIVSTLQLKAATGTLDLKDLEQINAWLRCRERALHSSFRGMFGSARASCSEAASAVNDVIACAKVCSLTPRAPCPRYVAISTTSLP